MNGKIIFTMPENERAEREIFEAPRVPAAQRLVPSAKTFCGFMGFGVAITPSSCYELSHMDATERHSLLEKIYSKEGLNLSVARLCVGSSDYSPELYSYDDVPFDTELKYFSIARDEAYVLPIIKEILAIRPDLYIYASPWTPPAWMKTGGSLCGGYMRDEFVDCYADYVIKYVKAYGEQGITISGITPQNESNTQSKSRMTACVWHPETEAKFIVSLRNKANALSLPLDIWMYDHNFNDTERVLWSLENCKGLREAVDGVAFHFYEGTIEETLTIAEKYPELSLHFTEGGPRLDCKYATDWTKWGLMSIKTMNSGYRSMTGWNLMLDELGGPNIGPYMGFCGGLVTRDHRDGSISYSGMYKAYEHIAPYVTPNSKLTPVRVDDARNCSMAGYPKYERMLEGVIIDNGAQKVAVIANPTGHDVQTQIELGGKLWYIEMHTDSLVTVIVEE